MELEDHEQLHVVVTWQMFFLISELCNNSAHVQWVHEIDEDYSLDSFFKVNMIWRNTVAVLSLHVIRKAMPIVCPMAISRKASKKQ